MSGMSGDLCLPKTVMANPKPYTQMDLLAGKGHLLCHGRWHPIYYLWNTRVCFPEDVSSPLSVWLAASRVFPHRC